MTPNPSHFPNRSFGDLPEDAPLSQQLSHLETMYAECLQANMDAHTLNGIYQQIKTLRSGMDGQTAPPAMDYPR